MSKESSDAPEPEGEQLEEIQRFTQASAGAPEGFFGVEDLPWPGWLLDRIEDGVEGREWGEDMSVAEVLDADFDASTEQLRRNYESLLLFWDQDKFSVLHLGKVAAQDHKETNKRLAE